MDRTSSRPPERACFEMMTVVPTVTLKDEATNQWDRAMHERVRAASDMDGWMGCCAVAEGGRRAAAAGGHRHVAVAGALGPLARRRDIQGNPRGARRARGRTVHHRLVRRGGGTGLRH